MCFRTCFVGKRFVVVKLVGIAKPEMKDAVFPLIFIYRQAGNPKSDMVFVATVFAQVEAGIKVASCPGKSFVEMLIE